MLGVNAIVFVLDSSDHDKIQTSKDELHSLLERPQLDGIPVLVLGNKNDLLNAFTVDQLIQNLSLSTITGREISCYSISAKSNVNIEITMQWLIKHAKNS